MATYNRPGVYLEEVSSSVALSSTPTATVATFMGYFAKGPLNATLVSSWSQFTSLYGDIAANSADTDAATAVYLFFANGGSQCYVQRVVVTVAAVSNTATSASTTLTIVSASSLSTSDGGSSGTITAANAIGATITGNGISAGTIITNVSSTTLTLSQNATVPASTALTITTTIASSVAIKGNTTVAIAIGSNVAQSGTTTTYTSAAHSLKVGQTVVIAGVLASTATPTNVYQGAFVVTSVPSSTTFSVTNAAAPASAVALTTAGTVTAQSSTTELTLTAKNPGAWSNGLYYEISSSTSSTTYPGKYFNLAIYSGGTSSGYIVERFSDLTLLATDPAYAVTIINASSNYVIASDPNAANHTAVNFATTNTPVTTALTAVTGVGSTSGSSTTLTLTGTIPTVSVGMIVVGNGVTSGTTVTAFSSPTVTLSSAMTVPAATSLTFVNAALTGGSDGSSVTNTSIAAITSTAKLDAITQPILLNAPGVTEATNVNALLTYAYNRGDVFVIIDPTQATLDVTSQLTLANSYTGGTAGTAALGFGAVYYPNLTIPNPTSSTPGSIATAYPGGAIAAKYATTDSSRGVFKSPAGLEARLSGVVSVTSLTNTELDYLNNGTTNPSTFASATPVNAIRYIPGSGIVVMGARTLSSTYNNRYVSVRRSLIYLRKILTDSTAFALFESNDERLWNRLQTTCEAILISFWQSGGLKGATALDAFYVKADSSINTVSSIAAGEVHLEIGVALQRPAEFVVIRISQYDSGSVVTVL
jgi:phage tail sheath protein FI